MEAFFHRLSGNNLLFEGPASTQDLLEGLYLPAGLGASGDYWGKAGGHCWTQILLGFSVPSGPILQHSNGLSEWKDGCLLSV